MYNISVCLSVRHTVYKQTINTFSGDDRISRPSVATTGLPNVRLSWTVVARLNGSALVSINAVTLRRARLILGWVTVDYRRVNHLGM